VSPSVPHSSHLLWLFDHSLLQCNDFIRSQSWEEISASPSPHRLLSLPNELDWVLWGELVSVMEPLNSVSSLLLQHRGECHLSLLWYIIDWIVCIYDQTSHWEVFSVVHGKLLSVPTRSLSQAILSFQSSVVSLLRESYLTDSLMTSHPRQYELLCLTTFLDPRTKDFKFFRSSNACFPPYVNYPALYHQDAKSFLLTELRAEICCLLELYLGSPLDLSSPATSASASTTISSSSSPPSSSLTASSFSEDSAEVCAVLERLIRESGGISTSSKKLNSCALRKCIDEYCRQELYRYEGESPICPPHQIRHHDPLTHWLTHSQRYPILSRVARRLMSIRMAPPSSLELKDLTDRVLSKSHRKPMCSVLFEAVIFLHLNGILDYQFPDRDPIS
jgi:hypothetical protein